MTKRMTPAAADYIWTLSEQIYDAEAEYIVAKAKDSPRQRILLERWNICDALIQRSDQEREINIR
jgi:hypothetical protein